MRSRIDDKIYKTVSHLKKPLSNSRGILTVDYIFAFVLVMGFFSVIFALSVTLTVAEVTQYITFSTARVYFPSHVNEVVQKELANQKWTELTQDQNYGNVFQPLYQNGWFEIDSVPVLGSEMVQAYPQQIPGAANTFWGAGTMFVAKVLDFQIPFFGATDPDGDGSGKGFQSFIASYLGREPTVGECMEFTKYRWTQIRNLDVESGAPYSSNTGNQASYHFADNGC